MTVPAIIDNPMQVAFHEHPRGDGWAYGYVNAEMQPMGKESTKKEALRAAKSEAKDRGVPLIIVLTKDFNFQRIWVNDQYFKDPERWRKALGNTEPAYAINYSNLNDKSVQRTVRGMARTSGVDE